MRLVCPECQSQYAVPDTAIPVSGRTVRCSACAAVWFQTPIPASGMSPGPAAPTPPPGWPGSPAGGTDAPADLAPAPLPDTLSATAREDAAIAALEAWERSPRRAPPPTPLPAEATEDDDDDAGGANPGVAGAAPPPARLVIPLRPAGPDETAILDRGWDPGPPLASDATPGRTPVDGQGADGLAPGRPVAEPAGLRPGGDDPASPSARPVQASPDVPGTGAPVDADLAGEPLGMPPGPAQTGWGGIPPAPEAPSPRLRRNLAFGQRQIEERPSAMFARTSAEPSPIADAAGMPSGGTDAGASVIAFGRGEADGTILRNLPVLAPPPPARRSGFAAGLALALTVFLALLAAYALRGELVAAVPAAGPYVALYAGEIDQGRALIAAGWTELRALLRP